MESIVQDLKEAVHTVRASDMDDAVVRAKGWIDEQDESVPPCTWANISQRSKRSLQIIWQRINRQLARDKTHH